MLTRFRWEVDYPAAPSDGKIATERRSRRLFEQCVDASGLIAQLAERVADNDEVSGSSPDGPITYDD